MELVEVEVLEMLVLVVLLATTMIGLCLRLAALAVMTSPATLMANPKSLYNVWNEYLHGAGGGSLQGFSPKLSEGGSSLNTRDKR